MKQLSGMDAAFLTLETHNSTGHVGGLLILDPSESPTPLDLAALTSLMNERLPQIPLLRQRLKYVPLGLDQPYWIDDENFDIEFHVREISLPAPGSDAQLTEQVGRLHARPLDRRRPLWEMYLISGLAGGRLALYTKMHHAAIDGSSGTELLTVLVDLTPEREKQPVAVDFKPEPAPSDVTLLAGAAASLATRPVSAVRIAAGLGRALPLVGSALSPYVGALLGRGDRDGDVIKTAPLIAPRTPFNEEITLHRRFAMRSVELDDVKRVKNAFGASVNDVVMAMSAGALRHWLIDHDALPDVPLVAMIPVSVRDEASKSKLGNRVSSMFASLPTHLDDPVARLNAVREATKVAKAQQAAIPPGLVENVSDFAPPALVARAARVAFATGLLRRIPPFNLVISNVPGPNVDLYLGGAKVVANYPVSVVMDGQGFNITVTSNSGQMHFGLISCRELVPDIDVIAGYLVEELDKLLKLAHEVDGA
jgi:diacylglycerol O-acyltransferase / wax synthase